MVYAIAMLLYTALSVVSSNPPWIKILCLSKPTTYYFIFTFLNNTKKRPTSGLLKKLIMKLYKNLL